MYFGESEKRTDSLEVKGEGTAEARGDSLVSGSYDRTWCCSFTRRASLERKLFGGSTCFFFFFLVQGVIILLSLLKDSFSGYAVVGWLAIPCPASTCGVTALCLPSLLLGSRLYQACFVESAVSLPPPCAAFSDFSLCLWFFVVSGFRAVSRGGFLGIGPYGNRWWWFFLVGQ